MNLMENGLLEEHWRLILCRYLPLERFVRKGVLNPPETEFVQADRQFSDTWRLTAKFAVTNAACKILQKSHHG